MASDDEDDPGHVPLVPRLTGEARRQALADPGLSWSDWFYRSFARAWIVLLFLVLDVFVISTFGAPLDVPALIAGLALAIYGEWLLYQYLWHSPGTLRHHRGREGFQRGWLHPVEFGRWTPEASLAKTGKLPAYRPDEPSGPDPREFL